MVLKRREENDQGHGGFNEVPGLGLQTGQCSSTWRTGDRQEHNVDGSVMAVWRSEVEVGAFMRSDAMV